VSLALFGAYVTTVGLTTVDLLRPFEFAGLLVGAMLPYWFSALTMKSVGEAAQQMVAKVKDLVTDDVRRGLVTPDYKACVAISTNASLKMMMWPGALVMLTPIIVGYFLGVECLAGVLAGALVSGVQMAISASNTGGAWDNAKKFIEQEGGMVDARDLDADGNPIPNARRYVKRSAVHAAAVIGDTVGDPLKDTSGPSLNILIKLMAIISLVFGPSFPTNYGGLLGRI